MKDKILTLIIGILIGAIISSTGFGIYLKTSNTNKEFNNPPEMNQGQNPNQNGNTPPNIPNGEKPDNNDTVQNNV